MPPMRDEPPAETGDGFHAELSDLRTPAPPSVQEPEGGARPPRDRQPSQGRRTSWLVALVAVGLLAALLALTLPGARTATNGLLGPPTPTLPPSVDEFYLLPNPPGVSVWLDGAPLKTLPLPGTRPLRLARGHHVLEWLPGWFPFQSQRCELTVPHAGRDTCALDPGYSLPAALVGTGGAERLPSVVEMRTSLTALPDAQAAALTSAIQQALDGLTATTTIAAGEYYFSYAPNVPGRAMRATEPLHATLRLRLRSPGAPGACALSPGAVQPCRAPGQDCSAICTLSPLPGTSGLTWPAGIIVSADWTYTTLSGQLVGEDLADPGLNANLAPMLIVWDGASWHVTPIIGHQAGVPAADDTLCDPARDWLASGPLAGLLQAADSDARGSATFGYASATTITGGCVVSITGYGASGPTQPAPAALFLQRFGVLLAANDAAHALWPAVPLADAAQARDAAALARLANLSQ